MDNSDANGFPGEYDPETEVYRIYYERDTLEPVSTVIVETVAALTDTPPTDLDPLYEILNPDALNHIYPFDPRRAAGSSDDHITFTYNDCEVRVYCTGVIEIHPDCES